MLHFINKSNLYPRGILLYVALLLFSRSSVSSLPLFRRSSPSMLRHARIIPLESDQLLIRIRRGSKRQKRLWSLETMPGRRRCCKWAFQVVESLLETSYPLCELILSSCSALSGTELSGLRARPVSGQSRNAVSPFVDKTTSQIRSTQDPRMTQIRFSRNPSSGQPYRRENSTPAPRSHLSGRVAADDEQQTQQV